jgi:uncharacterized tellurite resistance protein B-like protein
MFLSTLTTKQKTAFLYLAKQQIHADAVVSENEIRILDEFAREMQISHEGIMFSQSECEIIISTLDNVTRRKFFLELLSIAFADSACNSEGEKHLQKIQSLLGLPHSYVEHAKKWLHNYTNLVKKANNLVEVGFYE